MFRRKFLASLAGVAGCLPFARSSVAKAEPLPVNPLRDTPDRAYGLYCPPAEELNGLSPQAAFMLGVEWRAFVNQLDINPKPFRDLVHPANVRRCLMTAQESGRTATAALPGEHAWAAPYERDWRVIEIGPCPYRS